MREALVFNREEARKLQGPALRNSPSPCEAPSAIRRHNLIKELLVRKICRGLPVPLP
jgi:hypothetical protein